MLRPGIPLSIACLACACGGATQAAAPPPPPAPLVSVPLSTAPLPPEPILADPPPSADEPTAGPVDLQPAANRQWPACPDPPPGTPPPMLSSGARPQWAARPFPAIRQLITNVTNDEQSLRRMPISDPRRPPLVLALAHEYFLLEAMAYDACRAAQASFLRSPRTAASVNQVVEISRQRTSSMTQARRAAFGYCAHLALDAPQFAASHFCPTS